MAQLPLAFEPNHGQAAAAVEFQTRAPGYMLQLASAGMRLVVSGARGGTRARTAAVTMTWHGANPHAAARAEAMLPGTVNYLKGRDPDAWHTGIPTYERVRYDALYPGIDVVYYGNGRQLEYDLIVAPGADPLAARLVLHGADVTRGEHGGLDVAMSKEQVLHLRAPVAYQDHAGERRLVEARYRVSQAEGAAAITFDLGAYDRDRPLVIDPIVYSTLLGGSAADVGFAIAVNAAGEAFVTGSTPDDPTDFPVTAGAFDTAISDEDVFVTRLNSTGTALIYSTYLGGSSFDWGLGIAVNAANEAFVTGTTAVAATNFPVTAGAFDTVHGGNEDAFVTRLNASGTALIYSTLLGGLGYERGNAVALNAAGEAFVTGAATFANMNGFPVTLGAFDPAHNGRSDAFVTRVNATGSALVYSTFLGGSHDDTGLGIAVNAANEAFVTGETFDATTDFPTTAGSFDPAHNGGFDAFVTKVNAAGSALVYSTFLGGSDNDSGYGLAINAASEVFVTGRTGDGALTFPVTAGAFDTSHNGGYDTFVARLTTAGTALGYATFLGGGLADIGRAITVLAGNRVLVSGFTEDAVIDFPVTAGAVATTHGGATDAFVAAVNASGSALDYSTFLGGSGHDVAFGLAANTAGEAFVTGETSFDDMVGPVVFPTTAGAFDTTYNGGNSDVFVARVTTVAAGPTPTTVADTYTTPANTPLVIPAPGVLANDQSNGGGAMTAALVTAPANGALSLVANGSFVYTPNGAFTGTDTFTYRAVNASGPGTTAVASIQVTPSSVPVPPASLRVTNLVGNTVTLRWNPPSSGPAPTGYLLEGGLHPAEVLGVLPLGPAPAVTLTLPSGALYLRVRTLAANAASAPSNEILAFVSVPAAPSAPSNLLGVVVGTTVDLAWTMTYGGGQPTNVILEVSGSASGAFTVGPTERFSAFAVVPGTYTLRVRAVNASGTSAPSNPVTLTVPGGCSGAPLPVTNFLAYHAGSVVNLTWDLAASGPAPTSFVVTVTGAYAGSLPTTQRALSGAVPSGSYGFTVAAVNPCGASAPTPVRTVTVP